MMASLSSMELSSKQLASNLTLFNPSFVPVLSCRPNVRKVISSPRGKSIGCSFRWNNRKGSTGLGNSEGIYSVVSQQGHWEDPDDGSGSEYDDDSEEEEKEEVEENELEFQSNWAKENYAVARVNNVNDLSASNYEEDLANEVEQLLSPEERAILEANITPYLERISTTKWNLFHTFALAGQIKYMDTLLENGLDIDLVDKWDVILMNKGQQDGRTALHHAVIGKREAVISHLLRKGANPHVRDLDGATSLHYAVQVGALQTVKLLIKHNVDVNTADDEGWTPLHVAIQSRNRDIAKVLLVNGADKTRRNKVGNTPLDLSYCYGKDFKSYDLAKLLKQVPANRSY